MDAMETRLEKLALGWAALEPKSRAIVAEGDCVTYRDLQLRVMAAARRLSEIGLRRGDRIAISGQRSAATLIAMLAALSVGACVTPLDADWPKARSRAVLAMLKPALLISGEPDLGGEHVELDSLVMPDGTSAGSMSPPDGCEVTDVAFAIFTSGSTGVPKGVMLDHRGRVNNVRDICSRLSLDQRDSVLAISSPAFDMFVAECFSLLAVGGTVVMHPENVGRPDFGSGLRNIGAGGFKEQHVSAKSQVWHVPVTQAQVVNGRRDDGGYLRLVEIGEYRIRLL
jgi:non-ribosomal peptide synthetase component F